MSFYKCTLDTDCNADYLCSVKRYWKSLLSFVSVANEHYLLLPLIFQIWLVSKDLLMLTIDYDSPLL